MNYQDIAKVNSEISMIDLKGKNYAMVPERVNAFRKLYPEGFIQTEVISHEDGVVLMQTKAGYYDAEGRPVVLGTGFAQEVRGRGMVNGTSYIENCETSAVGRALGMIGLGINGGGICSAEELVNAITAQNQMQQKPAQPVQPIRVQPAAAAVETVTKLPEQPKKESPKEEATPVQMFLLTAMKGLREARGITVAQNNKLFKEQREALVKAKLAPDKPLEEYTMEEAEALIEAMYKTFAPEGTEIKQ